MIATEADLPMIAEMGREAHAGSVWDDLGTTFDPDSYEASCRALMERDDAAVFVSQRGTLWLVKIPLWFDHTETITQELFFYAPIGGDALRREGERWAEGLIAMYRHERTDPRLDRLYQRAGYQPIEHMFIRRA